ncbi:transcription factor PCL1-like [Curcuma longa]|uniref:transcription factor PCL1-like n=1 Tax=Curcuma longa TaxID=136217 RepID=UPI003D9DCA27
MGEEAPDAPRNRIAARGCGGYDGGRVREWEIGLPTDEELFPLNKLLVSPALAAAFRIIPEPRRTAFDVDRAVHKTLTDLRSTCPSPVSASALRSFLPFRSPVQNDDYGEAEEEEEGGGEEEEVEEVEEEDDDDEEEGSEATMPFEDDGVENPQRKSRRIEASEEAELSALRAENSNEEQSARSQKRPRLVWTPQLHKRFVDVVTHLGIKNAVPKTIMQLMNVEGLTRENVASHLQKYRLYLKRKEGRSSEGPSSSDRLFASTPMPQSFREHHHQLPPPPTVPVPYSVPTMLPMPIYGVPHGNPMVMMPYVNNHQVGGGGFHGFEAPHHFGAIGERPMDRVMHRN